MSCCHSDWPINLPQLYSLCLDMGGGGGGGGGTDLASVMEFVTGRSLGQVNTSEVNLTEV